MNMDQIKCFLVLSQTLNFTKTAEILYVTQPTISRQIKLLEEELGFNLFNRLANGIDITPEGRILYQSLSEAYNTINSGIEKALENLNPRYGSLRIGCEDILTLDRFLADCSNIFLEKNPNVNVSFEKRGYQEIREKLRNKEFDIVFTKWSNPNFTKGEKVAHIFNATGVLLYKGDDERWKNKDLKIEDFSNEKIVCLMDEVSPRGLAGIKKICECYHISCKDIIQVPNLESVFPYVHAGIAIAFMSKDVDQIYRDGLSYIELPDKVSMITGVAFYNDDNNNPAVEGFLDIVLKRRSELDKKFIQNELMYFLWFTNKWERGFVSFIRLVHPIRWMDG